MSSLRVGVGVRIDALMMGQSQLLCNDTTVVFLVESNSRSPQVIMLENLIVWYVITYRMYCEGFHMPPSGVYTNELEEISLQLRKI